MRGLDGPAWSNLIFEIMVATGLDAQNAELALGGMLSWYRNNEPSAHTGFGAYSDAQTAGGGWWGPPAEKAFNYLGSDTASCR
jgi:hypothetical protein